MHAVFLGKRLHHESIQHRLAMSLIDQDQMLDHHVEVRHIEARQEGSQIFLLLILLKSLMHQTL